MLECHLEMPEGDTLPAFGDTWEAVLVARNLPGFRAGTALP